MAHLIQLFSQYPWLSAACLWVFAALVHTMPAPPSNAGVGYTWLYNFFQTIGANLSKIGEKAPPKL